MSFTDRLVLALHIAFVIFTIGPVTAAIMSSPRAIRTRNADVLRYLLRTTRIFGVASLGILVFGIVLGQSRKDLGRAWLTVSMTLFVVALVLLILIMRDQQRALSALTVAAQDGAPRESGAGPPAADGPAPAGDSGAGDSGAGDSGAGDSRAGDGRAGDGGAGAAAVTPATAAAVATVERGRIRSLGGVVSLIWLAILVLMVWQP